MKIPRVLRTFIPLVVLAGLGGAAYSTRDFWLPWFDQAPPSAAPAVSSSDTKGVEGKILLTDQAQTNLKLKAEPVRPTSFWKSIPVPGMVVDRPGYSDRGVAAPVAGVVSAIHRLPGETVRAGEPLFTLRLASESLQTAQTQLFKTAKELQINADEQERLKGIAESQSLFRSRLLDLSYEERRLRAALDAHRQDLQTRGVSAEELSQVEAGRFLSKITIRAPRKRDDDKASFEMQELKADLGHQVQAGQLLCLLSNHQLLVIEGRAFRDETALIERTVKEGWQVEVDFQEVGSGWPPDYQPFHIASLANTIDPVNRTFAFYAPLQNQSRAVERAGKFQQLWRYRPGQKVRLRVPIEKLDNVFVLPADALVREGGEAYVFTQNVNTFVRKPVHLIMTDRRQAVLVNDGALVPGSYVVQSAAAQLNRMLKSQSNSVPKGYHVHADGSLHKNEDEGK